MPDDYLWDRTGAPDAEVVRLEKLLAPYRCPSAKSRPRRLLSIAALAASLAVAGWTGYLLLPRPEPSSWTIGTRPLSAGEVIRTEDVGARLSSAVGEVELGPQSRLRVMAAGPGRERLALDRGILQATIWAPPAKFAVDTPTARAIDLGCRYTLQVNPDGSGLVSVIHGWVAFQAGERESFVPGGAACRTNAGTGPGLPYFEDSPQPFREAIFDFESGRGNVGRILDAARREDALTLWHLLSRTAGPDREAVISRFVEFIPATDADGLRTGRNEALDHAWDALGLGGAEWWRVWKQEWKP